MPSVILATAGYDHTIRLWEARSGFCYRTLQFTDSRNPILTIVNRYSAVEARPHSSWPLQQVNKLEITPNKKYLAAAGNPHIKLFELSSNNPQAVSTFSGHKGNVTAIGFEKQGEFLFSGSEDGTVKIWDPRVPNHQREFEYLEACNSVELHPNQTQLVCGYQNGVIRIYDLRTSTCAKEFMPSDETNAVRSVSIASDGSVACVATSKGKCFVWRLRPTDYPADAAATPTEPSGVKGEGVDLVKAWDAHPRYVLKAIFAPNVSTLATASADQTVRIWDVNKNFELYRTLKGHQRWVWDCVYTSSSSFLVTASSDHVAKLWDLQTGEAIRHYSGHHKAISCVALNDDENSDAGQQVGGSSSTGSSSRREGLTSSGAAPAPASSSGHSRQPSAGGGLRASQNQYLQQQQQLQQQQAQPQTTRIPQIQTQPPSGPGQTSAVVPGRKASTTSAAAPSQQSKRDSSDDEDGDSPSM